MKFKSLFRRKASPTGALEQQQQPQQQQQGGSSTNNSAASPSASSLSHSSSSSSLAARSASSPVRSAGSPVRSSAGSSSAGRSSSSGHGNHHRHHHHHHHHQQQQHQQQQQQQRHPGSPITITSRIRHADAESHLVAPIPIQPSAYRQVNAQRFRCRRRVSVAADSSYLFQRASEKKPVTRCRCLLSKDVDEARPRGDVDRSDDDFEMTGFRRRRSRDGFSRRCSSLAGHFFVFW